MSVFRIITYNVQYNKALADIPDVIKKYSPDIICLQEVNVGKEHLYQPLFPGYSLAATSNSFYKYGKTFGLATFYKTERFTVMGSKSVFLPRTYYEIMMTALTWRGPRTALRTDFVTRDTNQPISIYNVHLTALMATNTARNRQLLETFEDLEMRAENSSVVVGDFNYPFRKRSLEKIVVTHQLKEATTSVGYTWRGRLLWWKMRWKFDFILYRELGAIQAQRLGEFTRSDHYPVLADFSF